MLKYFQNGSTEQNGFSLMFANVVYSKIQYRVIVIRRN